MTIKDKPYKKKISITIDEDLYDILNDLAQEDDRNLSNFINTVLRRHANERQRSIQQNTGASRTSRKA